MQITKTAEKILEQLFQKNEQKLFRIFIIGGGCSGFEYDFQLECDTSDDDRTFPMAGGAVVIDSLSWDYLSQATLDYRRDLTGARFIVHNPLVKRTCGCGSSFSL